MKCGAQSGLKLVTSAYWLDLERVGMKCGAQSGLKRLDLRLVSNEF